MDLKIKDKRALVFGGSAGIGRAIAAALTAEGVRVAIAARDPERLGRAAAEIGAAATIPCDLSKPGAGALAVSQAREKLGGIDILVCNTGGPPKGHFTDITSAQWQESFQNLFLSAVDTIRASLPEMRTNGWGRIILVSSTSAREPLDAMVLSNSLRAGLAGLIKTLSNEVAGEGVTINALLPGYIATDRLRDLKVPQERIVAHVPAGRAGSPEEFGAIAAFVASGPASYLCGQAIAVDGGRLRCL